MKYGLKIKNYQAGSVYEVMLGVRANYDSKDAMLTNSLFLDFLTENGLDIYKDKSTRDVICVDFRYGSRSFEEELANIRKVGLKRRTQRKAAAQSLNDTIKLQSHNYTKRLSYMYKQTLDLRDKFQKMSADDLRIYFYENGLPIRYPIYKSKQIIGWKTINYRMLYRTPGKAKKGSCMFIREELYQKAHDFLWMGLTIPKQNAPIVEIGAYSSLVTSSIEGHITIDPREILVVKDIFSSFLTKVVSIELDESGHCLATERDNCEVGNTMFDGQALIDSSIFPEWGNGFVLLRHHFCKMAAFNTHIQKFFRKYYGDAYDYAVVEDMWGNQHAVKDIKLITTDQAMKWLKFSGVTYDYWCNKVNENNNQFGVVKTAHKSKLGDVQRMSYQMVNSLDENSMREVMATSLAYVRQLKTNDAVFIDFLKKNTTFCNDFEVLVALYEKIPEFVRCDYFRNRRQCIISDYVKDMKTGRLVQNADNLVIVGSPYAMLLAAVGADVESDPTFEQEPDSIQCWTSRFSDGEYLAGFRNPFNSRNNLDYLHNVKHPYFDEYFDFGTQIIAANMNHTCFQCRNNGSD